MGFRGLERILEVIGIVGEGFREEIIIRVEKDFGIGFFLFRGDISFYGCFLNVY